MKIEFDRGTLRFADLPHACTDLPGLLWDPRVAAYRAPAFLYSMLIEELARRGLDPLDACRPPRLGLASWRMPELRPYQAAALAAWELGGSRGTVVLPTGSGKTRLALTAMARARTHALCLAPTRILLAQWLARIRETYAGPVGCLGDGERRLAPITVSTFESAYRRMAEIGDRFDLLVVDEAHHFGNGARDEALEMSLAPLRLGLTATPPVAEDALSRLEALIGPVVYRLAIGDLSGRYLAPFDLVTLPLDLSPTERRNYEADRALFTPFHARFRQLCPDASWSQFVAAAMQTADGRAAVGAWRRSRALLGFTAAKAQMLAALLARHAGRRTLVFAADNRTVYAVARRHLIMPITCDIGREERLQAIERFARGELRALVSARVLNEGMDVPEADTAILLGGTAGEREYVQRVGRLLRPGADKRALIYELVTRNTPETRDIERRHHTLAAREAALRHNP